MKNISLSAIAILHLSLILISCGGGAKQEGAKATTTENTKESSTEKAEGIPVEFLGNYHGIQASYNLKNQYGDDMLINGNTIAVPSSDYKFLLKENNIVNLQQTNLEDNSRDYYDGTFTIISDTDKQLKIECTLSDGKTSNPIYVLSINKTNKAGQCDGTQQPSFPIEKKQ